MEATLAAAIDRRGCLRGSGTKVTPMSARLCASSSRNQRPKPVTYRYPRDKRQSIPEQWVNNDCVELHQGQADLRTS